MIIHGITSGYFLRYCSIGEITNRTALTFCIQKFKHNIFKRQAIGCSQLQSEKAIHPVTAKSVKYELFVISLKIVFILDTKHRRVILKEVLIISTCFPFIQCQIKREMPTSQIVAILITLFTYGI